MPIPAYRAKQSTDTSGTGTLVLNAAASNARSFSAAFGVSARRVTYAISWATGFELGLGDFDGGSPGSLTRATVLTSSNGGALVTLPAGTKDVFAVFDPAAREVVSITATATLALTDLGNAVVFTGSSAATLNLPAVATAPLGAGWLVMNGGTAALTIDPSGAELINGAATLVLQAGQSAVVARVASAWQAAVMMAPNVTGDLSVSGATRIAAGTAALPGLTPSGDPDTGIWSPAANTLAVSIGGVEVARFDPASGGSFAVNALGASGGLLSADGGLELWNGSGIPYIDFKSAYAEDYDCRIQQQGNGLVFLTGGNGAASTRMTIPGSGPVSVAGDLAFNSGYGSAAIAYGCRAWVNFNGTGTVAIRASGNVSSITDNGTGDYTVNFTNAMPDANYAPNINIQESGVAGGSATEAASMVSITTSSVRFACKYSYSIFSAGATSGRYDPSTVSVSIFR
ncbi:MAG: hypothetical protein ING08_08195 [Roseomonas sp.]|nr:hypothetical protein [Roseomonas sp.]